MIRLEPRKEVSRHLLYLTPVLAIVVTIVLGLVMFAILGKNPFAAIFIIFFVIMYRIQLILSLGKLCF